VLRSKAVPAASRLYFLSIPGMASSVSCGEATYKAG
jgi:hypothetical protein